MKSVVIEVLFAPGSLQSAGIFGRDDLEEPLDEAFSEAGTGEIIGGGSGERGTDIAIEIADDRDFKQALALIRKVLLEHGAPTNTQIIRNKPKRVVYGLADE